jgi:hypothetical protein
MSYVGNIPAEKYSSLTQQTFSSPTGTNFVLSQSVTNSADIALFVDNVRQDPTTYTAVGTALTTSTISSPSTMYCLYNGRTTETVSPPAGSVDSSQLVAGSVDDSHISGLAASKLTGTVSTSQIADDAITLAKLAPGTDGNIISFDASGNPVAVATGTDGQVLTSAGAGSPPAFETLAGGKIGQVIQGGIYAEYTHTGGGSGVFTAISGFTATITPVATSSKVLVTLSATMSNDNTGEHTALQIRRASTIIGGHTSLGSRLAGVTSHQTVGATNNSEYTGGMILDSPSTTSAVTYAVYAYSAGEIFLLNRVDSDPDNSNQVRGISTITLMEVLA